MRQRQLRNAERRGNFSLVVQRGAEGKKLKEYSQKVFFYIDDLG